MLRAASVLTIALLLSGCDEIVKPVEDGRSDTGGGGSGPTCTAGGRSYPNGSCIKLNGSYQRCGPGGWSGAQMGGTGAIPPGCN